VRLLASVDLGGTNIAAALAFEDGTVVLEESRTTESWRGPAGVLERMSQLVADLGQRAGRWPEAVGIGVPGLVDIASGTTLFLPNLPTQWRGVAVAKTMTAALGKPVYLLNDARMAGLGELQFGWGRSERDFVYFTLGTGIGGAVVLNGALQTGPLGAAGELGHQTIVPDGPLCGCGNHGCLEVLACAPALGAEGVRLLRSGRAPRLWELTQGESDKVSPETMAQAAADDAAVADAIERVARYIGIGAANMVTALHPRMIVLGGGMAALGERLLLPVKEEIRKRVRMFPVDDIRVERSETGARAGMLGGIALAARGGVQAHRKTTTKGKKS
jgi:glucokinase